MGYALINQGIGSLRKEPDYESSLEDEALYGMKVMIIGQEDNWYKVMTHYRYTGYVNGKELLFNQDKIQAWDQAEKQVVIKSYADILSIPKFQGYILESVPRGGIVALAEQRGKDSGENENGFTKVMLCDGRTGYIRSSMIKPCPQSMYEDTYPYYRAAGVDEGDNVRRFLKEQYKMNEEEFRAKVTATALSYLGTQYRWGGKSSLGIDCSGLCSMSYMIEGLVIYRDAKIMEGFPVRAIPYEEAKKGDLLYFPGHIAMYLGNGKFVHSTGRAGDDGVVLGTFQKEEEGYREDLWKMLITAGTVF
ncbi:MAG: NlpC/P60 family protein [Lachnospiraceae bacterium]|nr:NlpC/P60 family protein [Lachnospiraceae bacterium]